MPRQTRGRYGPGLQLPLGGTLSREVDAYGLFVKRAEVDKLVDGGIVARFERWERDVGQGRVSPSAPGFEDPRAFLASLCRGGTVAMSSASLYAVVDRHRRRVSLPDEVRRQMYESVAAVRRSGVRVVEVDDEMFGLGMDLWFDVRQGRVPPLQNATLLDPLTAAAGVVLGVPLFALNHRAVTPYEATHNLRVVRVQPQQGGSGLRVVPP